MLNNLISNFKKWELGVIRTSSIRGKGKAQIIEKFEKPLQTFGFLNFSFFELERVSGILLVLIFWLLFVSRQKVKVAT